MKKFIVLGGLVLGTFAFANTAESSKEVKIEEDAVCTLWRVVDSYDHDGNHIGTKYYCLAQAQ